MILVGVQNHLYKDNSVNILNKSLTGPRNIVEHKDNSIKDYNLLNKYITKI